ncbi:hypothetical protein RB195_019196 [Necator americanus]|uniref:Uncharacterized protein n=1 Tax=Necator americanus TaxID=51031 RepID=A0ABR1CEV1_NECAM
MKLRQCRESTHEEQRAGKKSYEVYKSEFVHFDDVRGTTLLKKNLSLRAMESYVLADPGCSSGIADLLGAGISA